MAGREEGPGSGLPPALVRRRFRLAGAGLAACAASSCAALGASGIWAVAAEQYTAAVLAAISSAVAARGVKAALERVRKVRAGISDSAAALTAAAAAGGSGPELVALARDFGLWVTGSRSALTIRILPWQPAADFADRITREARTGLTARSLDQINTLVRAASTR